MAFKVIGSLQPSGAPIKKRMILVNSGTSVLLDSHKASLGFGAASTAGALVFGHLLAHSTELDMPVETTGAAGAAMGSYAGTYTAASNNQTVGKVKGEYDVSKHTLYSAEESQTIGSTTGSNLIGYKQDLSDENTLDESTAATTTKQYNGWGVDPYNTAQAIVNIYQSQVFGV